MAIAFDPASFRDRHARVFRRDGRILRALSALGLRDWELLKASTFFQRHVDAGTLVRTRRAQDEAALLSELGAGWAAVVEHDAVPFISYPYEWTFGMLRAAALLHLELLGDALEEGLVLKDATAYNVQFVGTRPVFIDTASFTRLQPGEVWHGYRQFCQTFVYPLMLQAYKDVPYQPWLRGSLEGISARDMYAVLSVRDLVRPGVLPHVILHAKAQARFEDTSADVRTALKRAGFNRALIQSNVARLRRVIEQLEWSGRGSPWAGYAETHSYSDKDVEQKAAFVDSATRASAPRWVWDLGANTGRFARVAADHADHVLALDVDGPAVERMYRDLQSGPTNILPLVGSLTDPSPGVGWRNEERLPMLRRGKPDLTLCLALVHHVVIGAHIPLPDFVDWLSTLGADVVIEFVTKQDAMVRRLLANKDDHYTDYDQAAFEARLDRYFRILARLSIHEGTRVLYHGVRES